MAILALSPVSFVPIRRFANVQKGDTIGHVKVAAQLPSENPTKSMSPTPISRSRGHRSVGVGDSDLVAVKELHKQQCLTGGF